MSRNFSGAVAVSVGSFQFQIAPLSSLHLLDIYRPLPVFLVLPSGILICCTGPFWSDSLCLFGFCLPSLLCLISTLTQTGGGGLLFRFIISVQSCYGEGGALQTDITVWLALTVFQPHWFCPVQGCLCFLVYTAQSPGCSIWSGPCIECGSSFLVLYKSADSVVPAFCVFPSLSGSGSQRLAALSPDAARLFPPWPQCVLWVGSQEDFI